MSVTRLPNRDAWGACTAPHERWGEPFTAKLAREIDIPSTAHIAVARKPE